MSERHSRPLASPASPSCQRPGVLVVDDDPLLLSLLQVALTREGLEVWTSASGDDAIERYRHDGGRIGVVLLDVCMPGRDGPATLTELRRLNPAVQACFMSGFLGDHTSESLLSLGALRLYEKPFRIEALSAELNELARGGLLQTA